MMDKIKEVIKPILEEIKDPIKNQKVSDFFMIDCKKYIEQSETLTQDIKDNKVSLDAACRRFNVITEDIFRKGDKIELFLDDKIITKKIKHAFRILCGAWLHQGKITRRGFEKPRGYPGDYSIIESVYDNKNASENIGYCSDNFFLNNEYPVAVRNRKDRMRELLIDYLGRNSSNTVDILNVGCGSCREIVELLLSEVKPAGKVIFNLVDQDEEALDFSKKALEGAKTKYSTFRFHQHNILEYIRKESEQKYMDILGKQDLAYSIGVTDYLPDRMLKKLITFCLKLLKSKGTLILAHKDKAAYKPVPSDWCCDWTFYPRDEKGFLDILHSCDINGFDLNIEREKSGVIMFFTLSKK
jgi:SAM-dependent methyltransferase